MIDLNNLVIPQWLDEFTHSVVFEKLGVLITFLYSMTPSFIPIPTEYFMWILISLQDKTQQFEYGIMLVIIAIIGGFIADFLILIGARNIHRLKKGWKKHEMKESHFYHKYGLPFFMITPSVSFLLIGLNEGLLIYAGHHHVKLEKILPYLVIGEIMRGMIGGIILFRFMGLI
jgi:hypothetical protein